MFRSSIIVILIVFFANNISYSQFSNHISIGIHQHLFEEFDLQSISNSRFSYFPSISYTKSFHYKDSNNLFMLDLFISNNSIFFDRKKSQVSYSKDNRVLFFRLNRVIAQLSILKKVNIAITPKRNLVLNFGFGVSFNHVVTNKEQDLYGYYYGKSYPKGVDSVEYILYHEDYGRYNPMVTFNCSYSLFIGKSGDLNFFVRGDVGVFNTVSQIIRYKVYFGGTGPGIYSHSTTSKDTGFTAGLAFSF